MNKEQLIVRFYLLIFLTSSNLIFGQETSFNILWDKEEGKPISYATIKGLENYSISNEFGVFEFEQTTNKISIQSVVYETLEIDFNFLKANDTIFMKPLTFELDEVIISKDGLYTQMLKTVLTDYALEPHKEKFFLRAVIRKNNKLYKIVDFSGILEKQALFDTRSKPMPKKNYKIQIENIRKVGIENREIDFALFSFQEFLTNIIRIAFNREEFDISYETTSDKSSSRITLDPIDSEKSLYRGYYILNEDNTFKEADVTYSNENAKFENVKNAKFRTILSNWKSSFERNQMTNKIQLNKATLKGKTEVYEEQVKDIFDWSYVYYSIPVVNTEKIKNNINLNKDMFDLKGDYNSEYWKNQEVLSLTDEMQEFINKVNSTGKNSDFKTKTNMK
ncbi:carboxypeptidase-like regulatory domain-containing protein [Psychroserpens burtonensis]|uniref:Carboxypeptidase-like regulatory domain-containing protein n=2 Tax=Psychroserpens burtonensis TaxID=49278 RepID=A0A5C7B5S7_9FLAO|nr:carboxypeptidase-like regulatory domain-containing protein [Psychroserpens burtonensis]TXE15275.1 carboxypeptidase-like regulatory domain-containing protein [Psychroserpens burtonensis]